MKMPLPPIGPCTIGIVRERESPKYMGDYYGAMTESAAENLAQELTELKKGLSYTSMAYDSCLSVWQLAKDVQHVPGRIICSAILCSRMAEVWRAPRDYDRFWTLDVVYGGADMQTQDHYSHSSVFAANAMPEDDYVACFLTSDAVVMTREQAAYHARVHTGQLPAGADHITSLVSEAMTADAWRIFDGRKRP